MLDLRVPHRAGVLENRPEKGLVGLFLFQLGASLKGLPEQFQGPACFVGDSINVGLPVGV